MRPSGCGKEWIMAFDYKKEYKEFYMPKNKPEIIDIPEMKYIAVRGKGDPNVEGENTRRRSVCFTALLLRLK